MPVHFRITTPEQVQFHYQIAGLVTRAMAWSLDQLLLLGLLIVIGWASVSAGMTFGVMLFLLGKFALDFGYYSYFEHRRAGQTPGKKIMRIRVISSLGGKLSFADVVMRNLLRMVDSPMMLPFLAAVGGAVALLSPLHRRLGDLAADTIVVRDVRLSLPQAMLKQQKRVNSFAADATIAARIRTRVTRAERDLMLDLMLRRDELQQETRQSLFQDAASYFGNRYDLQPDLEHLSDEQMVLNLALVVQDTPITG